MSIIAPPTIKSAIFKNQPCDFIVKENLTVDFDEQGEHLWLYVQKTGVNTAFVAKLLATWADIPSRDVGYSGLKDRHAITYQWFSLRLPKKTAPTTTFADFAKDKLHADECVSILNQHWHGRKLNRGTHKSNHFTITLHSVMGDKTAIDTQLQHIGKSGVPNFFGEQRFGRDGGNLAKSHAFFEKILNSSKPYKPSKKDLERHSLLISAARSHLFNDILSRRVADGSWDSAITGDVFMLDGTNSLFVADIDDDIRSRLDSHDIHPTISLYGTGNNKATDNALLLENQVFQDEKNTIFIKGLQKVNAKIMRRATRLIPQDLSWQWADDSLTLNFTLPKGAFATTVLDVLAEQRHEPDRTTAYI